MFGFRRKEGLLCPRKCIVKCLQTPSNIRRWRAGIISYPPSNRYSHSVDSMPIQKIEIVHGDETVPMVLQCQMNMPS